MSPSSPLPSAVARSGRISPAARSRARPSANATLTRRSPRACGSAGLSRRYGRSLPSMATVSGRYSADEKRTGSARLPSHRRLVQSRSSAMSPDPIPPPLPTVLISSTRPCPSSRAISTGCPATRARICAPGSGSMSRTVLMGPNRSAMALRTGCVVSSVSSPSTSDPRSGNTPRAAKGVISRADLQAESSNPTVAQPSSSGICNFQVLSLAMSSRVPSSYSIPICA